ncbi:MAG: FAD-dependent oxidoreductase [Cyanobacteria bacterium P01_H01_bin.15]
MPLRSVGRQLGTAGLCLLSGLFWSCDRKTVTHVPEPPPKYLANGRPALNPLPQAQIWECEVAVIGGSLGGIAAAYHAMKAGAQTCLIEVSPWLGGQISAQGVSAIDESLAMRAKQNYSASWQTFKQTIARQPLGAADWHDLPADTPVADINSCWVGHLCFPPRQGAEAAADFLELAVPSSPNSQWATQTAFKGAEFDETGREITAIYAVTRSQKNPNTAPSGSLSRELASWYGWSEDENFTKKALKLQAPAGKKLIVIDATDTGELVGWAGIPHRLGSESKATTGEVNASDFDNPDCTQAFTYTFGLQLGQDRKDELTYFVPTEPGYPIHEHHRDFQFEGFPVFSGRSFFHYRRIFSTTRNDPFTGTPSEGDITLVNWNRGNDWTWMNPPLILTADQLVESGQQQNWLGGIAIAALRHGEERALLFADWLIDTQSQPSFKLQYLAGADSPFGTESGLSMVPYIREGRRILGRSTAEQPEFLMLEADLRKDLPGGRDFSGSVMGVTHYDIDMHGCRYRNWEPSGEAGSAPAREFVVRPVQIPLEALIPQGVDNALIGGKGIAVSHIVNAVTRIHHGEYAIGGAAGVTAAWLTTDATELEPADIIPAGRMSELQTYLEKQGLRLSW